MTSRLRLRFWIEVGAATLCCAALVPTLLSHDWVEAVFGVEPDAGDGTLEWLVVVVFAVVAVGAALAARVEWRRVAV